MALPFALDPSRLPMNVLFPEAYRESVKMVVRDFAFFGVTIVGSVVGYVHFFG